MLLPVFTNYPLFFSAFFSSRLFLAASLASSRRAKASFLTTATDFPLALAIAAIAASKASVLNVLPLDPPPSNFFNSSPNVRQRAKCLFISFVAGLAFSSGLPSSPIPSSQFNFWNKSAFVVVSSAWYATIKSLVSTSTFFATVLFFADIVFSPKKLGLSQNIIPIIGPNLYPSSLFPILSPIFLRFSKIIPKQFHNGKIEKHILPITHRITTRIRYCKRVSVDFCQFCPIPFFSLLFVVVVVIVHSASFPPKQVS